MPLAESSYFRTLSLISARLPVPLSVLMLFVALSLPCYSLGKISSNVLSLYISMPKKHSVSFLFSKSGNYIFNRLYRWF